MSNIRDNSSVSVATVSSLEKKISELETSLRSSKIVSFFTVICAILSLVATFHFNVLQNERWDSLNQARISVGNCRFIAFAEMDYETLVNTKWVVQPSVYSVIEDGLATQKYRIYDQLCFWDKTKNAQISGSKLMVTQKDLDDEIERLGLKESLEKELIEVKKRYQLQFGLKNAGQLPARDITVNVDMLLPDGQKVSIVKGNSITEIVGGHEFVANGVLWSPLNVSFPEQVEYLITISQKIDDRFESKTIQLLYDVSSNMFSLRK